MSKPSHDTAPYLVTLWAIRRSFPEPSLMNRAIELWGDYEEGLLDADNEYFQSWAEDVSTLALAFTEEEGIA